MVVGGGASMRQPLGSNVGGKHVYAGGADVENLSQEFLVWLKEEVLFCAILG